MHSYVKDTLEDLFEKVIRGEQLIYWESLMQNEFWPVEYVTNVIIKIKGVLVGIRFI